MTDRAVRTLVVWCPDWPVVAAALPAEQPVAVMAAGRVIACSAPARAEGVEVGLRRRQADSRCPQLVVVDHDPGRDARAFEAVVAAVESFAPGVEVTRPGECAIATRGPSRYFGGERALVARMVDQVDAVLGSPGSCRVGVADGPFAALLAARQAPEDGVGVLVPPGESAAFLNPFPVAVLGMSELTDLWGRLGIRTLGDLAALPTPAVLARFGPDGAAARRLARGLDERPLSTRDPPPDLTVVAELDPPVEAVETAAFVAKSLSDRLCGQLARLGLTATRVRIEAETAHGEGLSRLWRLDGAGEERNRGGLAAAALAQRVRWQIEGWLEGTDDRPTAGLTLLRLVPDEVGPDRGRQVGFWGGGAGGERAARAWPGSRGCSGPRRWPPPWWRAVGDRPIGFAWWPGATTAPSPACVARTPSPACVARTPSPDCVARTSSPACAARTPSPAGLPHFSRGRGAFPRRRPPRSLPSLGRPRWSTPPARPSGSADGAASPPHPRGCPSPGDRGPRSPVGPVPGL